MLRSGVRSVVLGRPGYTKLDFLNGVIDPRMTFTRSTAGTSYNRAGTLISNAVDVMRFDHDPVTLAPRGVLIE